MRVHKIVSMFVLTGLFLSCGGDTVSKKEYDEIYDEYKILKESLDSTQTSNLNQAATINKTLGELAEISGNTLILRGNIENRTARITQAEQISNNIKAIKDKIASLESQIGDDSAYKKIVANLKTIIKEKEAEINSLKEMIESQNTTINQQQTAINQQQEEINQQQEEITQKGQQISNQQEQLQQAVKAQAMLLFQAASEFEQFAEDVPDVSRKKNQRKVDEWAVSMLSRSLLYYQKSQEYGVDASIPISRVKRRIATLSQN